MLPVLLGYLAGSVPFAFLLARRGGDRRARLPAAATSAPPTCCARPARWRGVTVMALDVGQGRGAVALACVMSARGGARRGCSRRRRGRRPHLSGVAALSRRQRRGGRGGRVRDAGAARDARSPPACFCVTVWITRVRVARVGRRDAGAAAGRVAHGAPRAVVRVARRAPCRADSVPAPRQPRAGYRVRGTERRSAGRRA